LPHTRDIPKPLVDVDGEPLIDRILTGLEEVGITQVVIVGGYRYEKLKEHLGFGTSQLDIQLMENSSFLSGNILSLFQALGNIEGDLLIMNADHLYPSKLIRTFLENLRDSIAIACDRDRKLGDDDMKVTLRREIVTSYEMEGEHLVGDDRLIGLLDTTRKDLDDHEAGYIGMTFVPKGSLESYRETIERTILVTGEGSCVEDALNMAVRSGMDIQAIDMSGFGWIEVDTPDDLKRAELCVQNGMWKDFWH